MLSSSVKPVSLMSPALVSQVVVVVKKLPANAGDAREVDSIPRLGKTPGGETVTLVFLPGESHGQRSLMDYSA